MPRVLLNFDHWDKGYRVHFIEADCRTPIGATTRFFRFSGEPQLRAFMLRCNLEDAYAFERSLRNWDRGSIFCNLTDEQYAKLK